MLCENIHRRVIMARSVAARWVEAASNAEYHLTVYIPGGDARNIPSLLDGLRAGRIKLSGMAAPANFGLLEEFDSVNLWSSDGAALARLASWFEARGYETSGVT